MSDLTQLIARRAEIDAQIVACKSEAVANVRNHMAALGVSMADLAHAPKAKRAPKYRNAVTGETWAGVGIKPKWVVQALADGLTLEQLKA